MILPASFIAMFGDPGSSYSDFKSLPLGQIADVRSGVTKGRKLHGKETVEVPYLRVANVQDGYLDLDDVRSMEVLPSDISRYSLEDGDILIIEGCGTAAYLGRGAIWRNDIPGCIHQNHIFRILCDRDRLLPEYLASLLRTKYANDYFISCAKNSSGLYNINSTQVKGLSIPLPPIKLQQKFVSVVEQWVQTSERLTRGLKNADKMLASLMDEAFTGQLTAEWEAANSDWITEQTAIYDRLSQLAVLSLMARRSPEASSITDLMHYLFLIQTEGASRARLHTFVASPSGPFAESAISDLQDLSEQGLVRIEQTTDEDAKVTIADPARVDQILRTS